MWSTVRGGGYTVLTVATGILLSDIFRGSSKNLAAIIAAVIAGLAIMGVGQWQMRRAQDSRGFLQRRVSYELSDRIYEGESALSYLREWSMESLPESEAQEIREQVERLLHRNQQVLGWLFPGDEQAEVNSCLLAAPDPPQGLPSELAEAWQKIARQTIWMMERQRRPMPTFWSSKDFHKWVARTSTERRHEPQPPWPKWYP